MLYILQSDQNRKGCYNALCPGGYVQIHKSIYPGLVYDKVNVPGGKQNTVHLSVAEVQIKTLIFLCFALKLTIYNCKKEKR